MPVSRTPRVSAAPSESRFSRTSRAKRTHAILAAALAMAGSASTVSRVARAADDKPITDADRAGARQLYFEGIALQEQGKYGDALDRFQRALTILPSAVTTRLHVAQCQTQLDKLVEATENYREITRTSLDAKSPEAYRAAQDQAKAELAQIESQIPALEIRVTPMNAAGMTLTIDDQATNTAFIGVKRPINPGTHKVVVAATGYGRSEQSVTIAKGDKNKVMAFTLQAAATPVVTTTPPPVQTQPAPPPYVTAPVPKPTAPPPPAYEGNGDKPAAATSDGLSNTGLLVSFHTGAGIPGGSVTNSIKVDSLLKTGVAFGGGAALRFGRYFTFGGAFEGTIYKGSEEASQYGTSTQTVNVQGNGRLLSFTLAYMSSPHSTLGFFAEIGGGYRWLSANYTLQNAAGTTDLSYAATVDGAEFIFGAGFTLRVSQGFRLFPRAQFGAGSFNKISETLDRNGTVATASGDIPSTAGHFFTMVGLGGAANFDFTK